MPRFEDLGRRIGSTEDLQGIIRTMKALAAVTIRQYERATESVLEYNRVVELGLQVVLRHAQPRHEAEDDNSRTGVVVFGSDYGLCGRFNDTIVGYTERTLRENGLRRDRVDVVAVGLRGASLLEAAGLRPDTTLYLPRSLAGVTALVQDILLQLDRWRSDDGLAKAKVFYNRHTEEAPAAPGAVQLLPLDRHHLQTLADQTWPTRALPLFTMEPDRLLAALVRQYLFVVIFRACVESMASENASRLASMQAAERNIEERLAEMRADYRRMRQAAITAELLDVVAGFESMRDAE